MKPPRPSLLERVRDLEASVLALQGMIQRVAMAEAALLTEAGYPDLAREFFGLEVRLPPKKSSGGVLLP